MSVRLSLAFCALLAHTAVAQMVHSVSRASVTGAAAAALRPDGTFELPDSVVHPPGQLGREDAQLVADDYLHNFGSGFATMWSKDHVSPIDVHALVPCGRPLYARSAYEPLSAGVSPMTRRRFGPHWVVAFCEQGKPSAIVTFSALATDLRASSREVRMKAASEADFMSFGYPAAANPDMFSPEGAARIAFARTGRRVATVPDLINALPPESAAVPRWRVTLESPVVVRTATDTTRRSRTTLFVGFSRIFLRSGLLDAPEHDRPRFGQLTDPITHAHYKPVLGVGIPDSLELVNVIK